LVKLLVKFPQVQKRNNSNALTISVWGKLSDDMIKYYNIGDFILIEGILSSRKIFEFTISKISPYLLSKDIGVKSNYSKI